MTWYKPTTWVSPFEFYSKLVRDNTGYSATTWMGLIAGHALAFGFLYYTISQVTHLDPLVIAALATPLAGLAGYSYGQKKKSETAIANGAPVSEPATFTTETTTESKIENG